jgi:hypothetical protein
LRLHNPCVSNDVHADTIRKPIKYSNLLY